MSTSKTSRSFAPVSPLLYYFSQEAFLNHPLFIFHTTAHVAVISNSITSMFDLLIIHFSYHWSSPTTLKMQTSSIVIFIDVSLTTIDSARNWLSSFSNYPLCLSKCSHQNSQIIVFIVNCAVIYLSRIYYGQNSDNATTRESTDLI